MQPQSPSNQNSHSNNPFSLFPGEIREADMYELMKKQVLSHIENTFNSKSESDIDDYDDIASEIKQHMDKLYGPPWHCIIGKGFGSSVTYNNKNMLFVYIANKAILLFRH